MLCGAVARNVVVKKISISCISSVTHSSHCARVTLQETGIEKASFSNTISRLKEMTCSSRAMTEIVSTLVVPLQSDKKTKKKTKGRDVTNRAVRYNKEVGKGKGGAKADPTAQERKQTNKNAQLQGTPCVPHAHAVARPCMGP